jgi:hypothetical protein
MFKVTIKGHSVCVVAENKYVAIQRAMYEKGLHKYETNTTKYKAKRI